jgi:hypothetical protein
MKFWEAMRHLEEGKKVTCTDWGKKEYASTHVSLDQGQITSISLLSSVNAKWELYEEPGWFFTFSEVVAGLKEGKRFSRKWWLKDNIASICMSNLDEHMFYIEDFEATDWIEVEVKG